MNNSFSPRFVSCSAFLSSFIIFSLLGCVAFSYLLLRLLLHAWVLSSFSFSFSRLLDTLRDLRIDVRVGMGASNPDREDHLLQLLIQHNPHDAWRIQHLSDARQNLHRPPRRRKKRKDEQRKRQRRDEESLEKKEGERERERCCLARFFCLLLTTCSFSSSFKRSFFLLHLRLLPVDVELIYSLYTRTHIDTNIGK